MTSPQPANPRRGEIWWVDLNPSKGSEIQKRRPCLVISSDSIGKLPVKIVVPITNDKNKGHTWHVKISPDTKNGLKKLGFVDVLQVRCVSMERFTDKIGTVHEDLLVEAVAALAIVIEHS